MRSATAAARGAAGAAAPSHPLGQARAAARTCILLACLGALFGATPALGLRAATEAHAGERRGEAAHTLRAATEARTRTGQPRGEAFQAVRATDLAHLRLSSAKGEWLYETGFAKGTIPGFMQVHMRIGARFTGSFLIHTADGVIRGHGSAYPHGSGEWESFKGSLVVTGGSGRYSHAHGRTGLYGAFNRRTYALNVKTTGVLRY